MEFKFIVVKVKMHWPLYYFVSIYLIHILFSKGFKMGKIKKRRRIT